MMAVRKRVLSCMIAIAMMSVTVTVGLLPVRVKADTTPLLDYANTLVGTNAGQGSTVAGPTVPNGSIHPSPETRAASGGTANGGYISGDSVIGFGQLYAQGTGGTKSYGNFLLSPQTGGVQTNDANHMSTISNQTAKPNYHALTLNSYGIKAEVTPTQNAALYRFTYPANSSSSIVLDVSRKIAGDVAMKSGSVNIDTTNQLITGGGIFHKNWNDQNHGEPSDPKWYYGTEMDFPMYFAMQYDKTPSEIGVWQDSSLQSGVFNKTVGGSTENTSHMGAYLKFATTASEVVNVKIAISFDSTAKATSLLNSQIPAWDFDAVRTAGAEAWNQTLGKIELGSSISAAEKTRFYTAMYHANVQPRNRVSDHGNWDDYYTIWDSWKTEFPLLNLIAPEVVAQNINSFINRYNESGYITDAYIGGLEWNAGQGGNDIENVIADAYMKGISGVDWTTAYNVVKGNSQALRTPSYISKGYVPSEEFPASAQNGVKYTGRFRAGSATAAFAYNDWAIAQMAKGLGYTADYNTFLGRSRNWQNIWNPEQHTSLAWETKDYAGFLMNRKSDGSFVTGANTTGSDKYFYEANMHEGSYTNTYDMATLISLMGGREQYVERLEYAFDKPCYKAPYWNTGSLINFTNEPAFQIPWTFATPEVGRPDLASKWANEFYKKYTDTTYPGDEDNGAMSSMYIFLNSGFMPFSCTNNYYLHGARLPEITYNLAGNKQFTIIGNNTGANNFYVQSATLNGQPLNRSYITYDEIKNGGTLVFNMGSAPSSWAQDPTATTSASSSQAASSTSSTVTSITTTASTPSTAANTGSTRVVYDWEAQNGKTGKGISGLDNGDTSIWNTSFLATAIPNSAPGSTVGLKGTWAVTYSDKTQFHITLPAGWATDTTGLKLWLGTSRASQTAEVRFSNGIQYSLNVTSTGGWYNVNWADKNKTAEDLATATTVSIWFYQTTSGDIAYLDDIIATLSTSNTTLTTITTPTTTSTTTATTTTSMTVPTTTTATTTTTVTTTQSTSLSTALSQQTTTDLTTSDHKYTIPYQTNNGLLWGINHRGNDAAVFRSSFQPQSGIEIRLYDKKGNLNRDGSVGTSTKVQIYENDAQISEYTVILYGDVDSDGKITAIDMLKIKKKLLKMPLTLNEYEAIAADCSVQKDGSIDVFDLLAMKRHLLKIEFINQN